MSDPCRDADPLAAAAGWRRRTMAFLRFLAFAVLAGALMVGLALAVPLVLSRVSLPLSVVLAGNFGAEVAIALASTALLAWAGGRKVRDFGWGGRNRGRNFLVGIATGGGAVSCELAALMMGSAVSFSAPTETAAVTAAYGLFYAGMMLAVAVAEETLFRGYALVSLSESLSFWPAALIMAVLFGLAHELNAGETPAGLGSVAIFGTVFAYSFRRTGSLWFACGVHASWDFAQTFVFGVPDSGLVLPGTLIEAHMRGPDWLTGGAAGPEGSVLSLLSFAAMVLVVKKFLAPGAEPASLSPSSASAAE